ncbi:MAG: hypothetical protein LBU87_06195 [Lactobacillales bacterium]|jgi:aspartate kinase|nr:hypothetical protein [Lactobacillales bacterium]
MTTHIPPYFVIPSGITVLKFGGTSMGRPESNNFRRLSEIVRTYRNAQRPLVVVCSAYEGETNRLVAESAALRHDDRQYDAHIAQGEITSSGDFATYLNGMGICATVMNRADNLPVFAEGAHKEGVISRINVKAVVESLNRGNVTVIPGFVARNPAGDIITIGRNGSDASAVEIGRALKASVCLFKDVDGIYRADPRVIQNAEWFNEISFTDALAMAENGSKIVYSEALRLAMQAGFSIRICPTFPRDGQPTGGTLIKNGLPQHLARRDFVGVTSKTITVPNGERFISITAVGRKVHALASMWQESLKRSGIVLVSNAQNQVVTRNSGGIQILLRHESQLQKAMRVSYDLHYRADPAPINKERTTARANLFPIPIRPVASLG